MSKKELKKKIYKTTNGKSSVSSKKLPEDTSLYDTHRIIQRVDGGGYDEDNTQVLTPEEHMELHGNLRIRDLELDKLKALVDEKWHFCKMRCAAQNKLLAFERGTKKGYGKKTDFLLEKIEETTKTYKALENQTVGKIRKQLKVLKDDPLIKAAMGVRGIDAVTVATCYVYIDLEKARHPSSLWKYVGLHTPSHKRYIKGEKGGGNKKLRTALYAMGDSQIKIRGAYRKVYDDTKARLEVSDKKTTTRIRGKSGNGSLVEKAWKDTSKGHRHGAAIRKMSKHFLADYWYVGRTLKGLETEPSYAEAILGKSHKTINPSERGWRF